MGGLPGASIPEPPGGQKKARGSRGPKEGATIAQRCDDRAESSAWLRNPSLFVSSCRNASAVLPDVPSDDNEPLERVELLTPGTLPGEPDEPLVPAEPDEPIEPLLVEPRLLERELREAEDEVNSFSETRPSLSVSRTLKFAAPLLPRPVPWLEPSELLEPVPLVVPVPLEVLPEVEEEGD